MEKQTRSARRKEKPKANQADSNLVLDLFLKLRYLIGVLVIVVIVTFNLNGSSLGVWDKYVSQRDDGKKTDVIFGQNREVRSDEWLVQTPFYLSQAEEDFPLVNEDYSLNGQNMIIAYNSPVKDIADRCICADVFSSSPVVVHAACGRFDFLYFGTDDCFLSLFLQS